MISFTGSEPVGVEDRQKDAATTVKRVCQELGGKSANIVLDDDALRQECRGRHRGHDGQFGPDLQRAARACSCPSARMDEAITAAREAADGVTVGDPRAMSRWARSSPRASSTSSRNISRRASTKAPRWSPAASADPKDSTRAGIVKPTVFANVTNDMVIAREEIFGPVLVIIGYDNVDHAVEIANDTDFGLAGICQRQPMSSSAAPSPAGCARAGSGSTTASISTRPFGGYKRSGNGREWGEFGFHEYLEIKSLLGYAPAEAADDCAASRLVRLPHRRPGAPDLRSHAPLSTGRFHSGYLPRPKIIAAATNVPITEAMISGS